MLASLMVLVVFLTPHPSDPLLQGFEDAALQLMAEGTGLTVKLRDGELGDAGALALGPGADGIVQLWCSESTDTVRLRAYFARDQRWVERQVSFEAGDPEYDRGRVLGFVVASMFVGLPEVDDPEPIPPEPPAPEPEEVAPRTAPTSAPVVPSAPAASERDATSYVGAAKPFDRRALEFTGLATMGLGGDADTLGARAALAWRVGERLFIRPSFALRLGDLPAAEATTNSGLVGLGATVPLLPADSALNVELRADLLGGWLAVTHFSDDDPEPVRLLREQFGADLMLALRFGITKTAAVFASTGMEAMLGATDVYTRGELATTIPRLRSLVEFGARTEF